MCRRVNCGGFSVNAFWLDLLQMAWGNFISFVVAAGNMVCHSVYILELGQDLKRC